MRLRTKTLRPGYRLYHGTSAEFADAEIQGPAFFSEKPRVARWFVNWHGEPDPVPYGKKLEPHARIITYRVTQPLRLLLIPDKATFDEITYEALGGEYDVEMLADWVQSQGYDGWFIPDNYREESGADIMILFPESLEPVGVERLGEAEEDDFDLKDIDQPDINQLIKTLLEQAGVVGISLSPADRTTIFSGQIHRDRYPTRTKEGIKIEVADLCYAQQLARQIAQIPGVERANARTYAPAGNYQSPWRVIAIWVLWSKQRDEALIQNAKEIVNFLLLEDNTTMLNEVYSEHLRLAAKAAHWIWRYDREFFKGSGASVSVVLKRFLERHGVPVRLITGYAVFRKERVPHAWLMIGNAQYDPVYTTQQTNPQEYEAASLDLEDFGVDEESPYLDHLVGLLEASI